MVLKHVLASILDVQPHEQSDFFYESKEEPMASKTPGRETYSKEEICYMKQVNHSGFIFRPSYPGQMDHDETDIDPGMMDNEDDDNEDTEDGE